MSKKTTDMTPELMAFASPDLADAGQGVVLVARASGKTQADVATFVVDVHSLGVRKVSLTALPLKKLLDQVLPALQVGPVAVSVARGIVEGATAYAKKLGFSPPGDYANALEIFGAEQAAPPPFAFGKNGKPFYTQQPGDDEDFVETVLTRLEKSCGAGGFGYELDEPGEDWLDGEEGDEAPEEE